MIRLITLDELHTDAASGCGRFTFFNRQSSRNNANSRKNYEKVLKDVHNQLSLTEPFALHFCDKTGNVKILKDAFNSGNVDEGIKGTYFEWLVKKLQQELSEITAGEKLYVIFASNDRIFRPIGYDPQGSTDTWEYDAESCMLFQKLMDYYFNEQSECIVFVCANGDTPVQCRIWQTKLGQAGNKGGRPRQYNKAQIWEQVLHLASKKMNAGQIKRYLLAEYGMDVPLRTIQHRMQKAKLSAKVGRPIEEKYATLTEGNHSDTGIISTSVTSNSNLQKKNHVLKPSEQRWVYPVLFMFVIHGYFYFVFMVVIIVVF